MSLPYIPYTYYLFHLPTQQHYYGVSFATRGKKRAHPSKLWVTYFSSSRKVWALIKKYGLESFKVEIRRTFTTQKNAIDWEAKVLSRLNVKFRSDWLNDSQNRGKFIWVTEHSEITKAKMRAKRALQIMPPKPKEERARISETNRQTWLNTPEHIKEERRRKQSEAAKRRYRVTPGHTVAMPSTTLDILPSGAVSSTS